MPFKKILFLNTLGILAATITPLTANAACDCGSTDANNPCTGKSIIVTVNGTKTNNVYNWSFHSGGMEANCGQFANGDFWVSPAKGESTVTITAISSASHPGLITTDADPHMGSVGLLDGSPAWSGHRPEENIIPNLPASYTSATSIVAAIQRDEVNEGPCGAPSIAGSCVDSYNVVTVLPSVPEESGANMIRPNITGKTKELLSLSDFDLTRIPSTSILSGTDSTELENIRKRWSHHTEIFGGFWSIDGGTKWLPNSYGNIEESRAYRSHLLVDNYAAGTAARLHSDLAFLFSDKTPLPQKVKPIAALLSYGLDIYHAMLDAPLGFTTKWGTGAGQHLGKFTPVVFLAALEKDNQNRLSTVKSIASIPNSLQPQELAQLHEGPNGPVWGDEVSALAYWTDLFNAGCYDGSQANCNTNTGSKTGADPYKLIDGPATIPGGSYFRIGYAGILNFSAIMHLMPSFRNAVNTSKPIDFVHRARTHGLKTLPDTCVSPDTREKRDFCNVWSGGSGCSYYYPNASISPTWGPIDPTDSSKGCVSTTTPGYTQRGRFARLDGTPAEVNSAYISPQLYHNWDSLLKYSQIIPSPLLISIR